MSEPIRLSKQVAALATCSRRDAEQYIEGGWVKVDGEIVEEPYFKVGDQQVIELHPRAELGKAEPATILLHKPAGVVIGDQADAANEMLTLANRWPEDANPMRLLRRHFTRLVSPLPLDASASGMWVLSQSWQVLRKLDEEADRIEQEFNVDVEGEIEPNGLTLLNHGLQIEGWRLPERKVSWQNETRLRFAIRDVRPGLIEAMCAAVGLQATALKRIRIGRVSMAKMQPGQWRLLAANEKF
ncbi:MAG: RNA pseudouridine synthase [Dokdonella sp.]